jgi:hypothetical protein
MKKEKNSKSEAKNEKVGGPGKVANVRFWSGTMVMDVLLYCSLTSILKTA